MLLCPKREVFVLVTQSHPCEEGAHSEDPIGGCVTENGSVIYLAHFQNEVSAILCHGTSLPASYFQRKKYQCESCWFPIELRCLCLFLS